MPVDATGSRRTPTTSALALASEPELVAPSRARARRAAAAPIRGAARPIRRSGPIRRCKSVCRALDVLRAVNKLRIASVQAIHEETGFPKPTIVRMLETLARRRLRGARQHVRRLLRHQPRARADLRPSGHLADHRGGAAVRRRADAPAQMADRHRRDRRRRDRDQVLDRRDQPVGAHQHGARAAARPGDDRDGPRASRVLLRRASASGICAGCAPIRSASFGESRGAAPARDPRSRCAPTASRRAIRRPSPIAPRRWRCRSARARPCTR